MLKVSYGRYDTINGEFGHLFHREPFSLCLLRPEYHSTGDQRVSPEVEVHRNRLIHPTINGKTVFEYGQPRLDETDRDIFTPFEVPGADPAPVI